MAEEKSSKKPEQKPKKSKSVTEKTEKVSKKSEKTEQKTNENDKKSKKGLLFGLIGAVVVAGGAVAACLLLNKKAADDPTASPRYSKSFFIGDSDVYTLWNSDGKRLTEDEYKSHSDFVGGYAMVKKDDQYGIIREDGKMAVAYGTYKDITAKGGLYLARTEDKQLVLKNNGNILLASESLTVSTSSSTSGFAIVDSDKKISTYFYDGTQIMTADKGEDIEDPKSACSSDFCVVFYAGRNFLFDVRTRKVVATFDAEYYKIDEASADRTQVILKSSDDSAKYKLVAANQIYDLSDAKYYSFTMLGHIIGYDDFSEIKLLGADYKPLTTVKSSLALKDSYNYATIDDNDNVIVVRNGNTVKTFDKDANLESGVLYDDFYVIENDGKFGIYNLDGNLVRGDYKDIWSLYTSHHHVAVAEEEDKYYLIDVNGNRVSDTYYRIKSYKGGYVFRESEDGKYAIASSDLKNKTEFKYSDTYYRSSVETRNIWTGKVDTDKHDVIDLDSGKVIASELNVQNFYENYFTAKNSDGKTEYYTYTGEKFYTSKS